jgi:hypothetical protein
MMKKTEIILALLGVSIILCLVTPGMQAVPTYNAGVSPNQVATYSYSGTMSYNNPTAIHIRSVSGSIVNYRRDSSTTDVPLDVADITSYSPWWFVSENMVVGDRFEAGVALYFVNSTISKNIGGQTWTANQINATVMGIDINALFDKATGLMLCWEYDNHGSGEFLIHVNFALSSLTAEAEVPVTPIDPTWIVVMALAGIGISVLVASRKMVIRSASE